MRFGKNGMSGESKTVVAILMVFGVLFMISFVWSFFSQGGGPPTGPDAVIKYYDDLLKGEYGGKKYSPTSLVIVLFVPLITSFSLIWTLARILPVFRIRENRQAAAVLAMGLSIYVVPTMSWMILQVFPPLLGVSAILIGVAMLLMAVFVLVSTTYQFGGLKWGKGGGTSTESDYSGGGDSGKGWGIFGGDKKGGGEEKATGVRLKEAIENLINKFNEDLDANWNAMVQMLEKNKEIKDLTDQQKEILSVKFARWLESYIRKFQDARSRLRPGCGIDETDKIELDAAIELVEQRAVDLLGDLKGVPGGGKVVTSGSILSKYMQARRAGKAAFQKAVGAKYIKSKSTGPKKELSDEDKDNAENLRDLLYRHNRALDSYLAGISDHVAIKIHNKQNVVGVEYESINDHKDFNKLFLDKIVSITQTRNSFINSLTSPKPSYYGPAGIYSELDKFVDRLQDKLIKLPADVKPTDFDQLMNLLQKIKEDVFKIRNLIEKYS